MIKNEYMKLSRDASNSHRRLKSDPDVLDGIGGAPAAEEDIKKVCTHICAIHIFMNIPVLVMPGRNVSSR